jgi:hypothetical protein
MSLIDMDMNPGAMADGADAAMIEDRQQYVTPRDGLRWKVMPGKRIRIKK